jgi:hypothetical protein
MKKVLLAAFLAFSFLCCQSSGQPNDYFPTKPGTTLTYKIEIGEVTPLLYEEVDWPQGKGYDSTASRGVFVAATKQPDGTRKKTFCLVMRVVGSTPKLNGVEVAVEKDDLGVYENAKQVFWSATADGQFMCREVVIYPPYEPRAPQGFTGDGCSTRTMFFSGKQASQQDVADDSQDRLIFKGTSVVPGLHVFGLHFVRTVESNPNSSSGVDYLNQGFEEHSYFVKGKGLVFRQQKIGGKVSMTWTRTD